MYLGNRVPAVAFFLLCRVWSQFLSLNNVACPWYSGPAGPTRRQLPPAEKHGTGSVRRDGRTETRKLLRIPATNLFSDGIVCSRTNYSLHFPGAPAIFAAPRTFSCTRRRDGQQQCQRRQRNLGYRATRGPVCLVKSEVGLYLFYGRAAGCFFLPEQRRRITFAYGRHDFSLRSRVQPLDAAITPRMATSRYDGRCWIRRNLPSPWTGASTCPQLALSRQGMRPREPKLPATSKVMFHSCRPEAKGSENDRYLIGNLRRSSTNANDPTSSLDGIIPVVKPKGLTSGDVCLQVAKLRQLYWEQASGKSAQQADTSGTHTVVAMDNTSLQLDRADGRAPKPRTGVGHGGTLDPAASGVLVVAIGKGTKLLPKFLTGPKGYRAVVELGVTTDTLDASGVTTEMCDCSHVSKSLLQTTIRSFIGKQLQQPPLYSAKRVRGVRMYHIARELRKLRRPSEVPAVAAVHEKSKLTFDNGVTAGRTAPASRTSAARPAHSVKPVVPLQGLPADSVTEQCDNGSTGRISQARIISREIAARQHRYLQHTDLPAPCEVEIYDAKLVEASAYELPYFEMEVHCSKGTYIRQLAADIAARCHTVGHVVELTRIYQAPFHIDDCVPLAGLDVATLRRHLLRVENVMNMVQR